MTENNVENNKNLQAESVNKDKHKHKNMFTEEEIEELHLGDDDFEYKEVGIWKNPYALAVIVISIWFCLWLFINVFMGRWFS